MLSTKFNIFYKSTIHLNHSNTQPWSEIHMNDIFFFSKCWCYKKSISNYVIKFWKIKIFKNKQIFLFSSWLISFFFLRRINSSILLQTKVLITITTAIFRFQPFSSMAREFHSMIRLKSKHMLEICHRYCDHVMYFSILHKLCQFCFTYLTSLASSFVFKICAKSDYIKINPAFVNATNLFAFKLIRRMYGGFMWK